RGALDASAEAVAPAYACFQSRDAVRPRVGNASGQAWLRRIPDGVGPAPLRIAPAPGMRLRMWSWVPMDERRRKFHVERPWEPWMMLLLARVRISMRERPVIARVRRFLPPTAG